MLREWDKLPKYMQTEEVGPYYDSLKKKKISLTLKRGFDVFSASVMLVTFSPVLIAISIMTARDQRSEYFYRQTEIRSMEENSEYLNSVQWLLMRIKLEHRLQYLMIVGLRKWVRKLRKYRLDELPQLINIILGDMTLVGTRPESTHYVKSYTPEMFATLLLPAGVTSEASIKYKDEADLLDKADDVDKVYIEKVLPEKMKYNLESIKQFNFLQDIKTMIKTVFAVIR